MSQSLTSLSSTNLKNLKSGETIIIWWKADADTSDDNRLMLSESYPKNIATTFSTKFKAEFPLLNQMKTGDILKFGAKKSITLIGGNIPMYKGILRWMLDSCNGKGLAPLPTKNVKPFTYQYYLCIYSAELGCNHLTKLANAQMEAIAAAQIHSEDVRALWNIEPPNEVMRARLIEHVGTRFFEKRLIAPGPYVTLRKEIPKFGEAIDKFCEDKKTERAEEKKRLREAREQERQSKKAMRNTGSRTENAKAAGRKGTDSGYGSVDGDVGAETKTVTLQMEVVRKGTKKQPTYAKVHLGDIGVTKERFTGQK